MQITVKLFATFRLGRFKESVMDFPKNTDCSKALAALDLKEEDIGVILVDGKHASMDHILEEGEVLALFPLIGGG